MIWRGGVFPQLSPEGGWRKQQEEKGKEPPPFVPSSLLVLLVVISQLQRGLQLLRL